MTLKAGTSGLPKKTDISNITGGGAHYKRLDVPPLAKSATWYMKTAYKMQNLVIKWVDLKKKQKTNLSQN